MLWQRADPTVEIGGLLERLRVARADAQRMLQDAEQRAVAAMDAELRAHDAADSHRAEVHALTVEIDTLLDELSALIPKPRETA